MSVRVIRRIIGKLKRMRNLPPEARAVRTRDFARLYKRSPDPWHVSKRVAYYRDVWEWIFARLPAPVESVVDAGCGVGAFLKALVELRPGIVAEGIEFSGEAAEKACQAAGVTIHTGDISKQECFRNCRKADMLTLNDVLYYLPGNGAQGLTNCLRFLQPRYLVISQSPADSDADLLPYEHAYSWDSEEASLVKIAGTSFDLPTELDWPGKHFFALYKVDHRSGDSGRADLLRC